MLYIVHYSMICSNRDRLGLFWGRFKILLGQCIEINEAAHFLESADFPLQYLQSLITSSHCGEVGLKYPTIGATSLNKMLVSTLD